MASSRAVADMLKILSRAFAGTVDKARIELYRVALDDVTDQQLGAAAIALVKTHQGEFIPPPAVIRAAVGVDRIAPSEVESTVHRIKALATYNAASGMIWPPVAIVRRELGAAVAEAYAAAGAQKLFSENETSRDIARREFGTALVEWTRRESAGLLPAAPTMRELDPYADRMVKQIMSREPMPEDTTDAAD